MVNKWIKRSVAVSLLSLTAVALAGGPDQMAMPNVSASNHSGGFFVGAAGGIGMLDQSINTSDVNTASSTSDVSTANVGATSFLGGLLLGYQAVFSNNVYLAVVGNALYNSLNKTISTDTDTSGGVTTTNTFSVKNGFQGGAALRLGRRIDSATPYISLGVEAGSFKNYGTDSTNNSNLAIEKTLVGPQLGAGVLFDIMPQWSVGLEYAYTWFGDLTWQSVTSSETDSSKFDINQGQALASLNYQFS